MPHPRQTNLAEESYKIFIPQEYLNDFASPETKELGKEFIKSELQKLEGATKRKTEQMIEKVDQGERDIYL